MPSRYPGGSAAILRGTSRVMAPMQRANGIDPTIRHVVCIGLMASARTTVGEHIAAGVGWPLVDVAAEVESRTGSTVAELSYEGGEDAYRPWERQVVLDGLVAEEHSVLMAPGGIALDP